MLSALRIQNLALVENLAVDFEPGFNVLPGEPGAGKSILVEAIGLVLGHRADAHLVRRGADQAPVEAIFSPPEDHPVFGMLAAAGISVDVKEDLLVRRVVLSTGKSRCFINDQSVAVGTLEQVARTLVELAGQHSQQVLLKEDLHLDLLDAFGRHETLGRELAAIFSMVQNLRDKMEDLLAQEKDKQEKLEFYRFQSKEIASAQLTAGEEENLQREADLLSHAQKWQELAAGLSEELYESENSLVGRVGVVQSRLAQAEQVDPAMAQAAQNVQEAVVLLKDAADAVRNFQDKVNADPQRLEAVQDRLVLIEGLKRKHARTVEGLLELLSELKEKIRVLENLRVEMEDIEVQRQVEEKKLQAAAQRLTAARSAAAQKFAREILKQWRDLGMDGAGLRIDLEPCALGEKGAQKVRFMAAPNKGEGFKPLAAIASGGEISRILLSIKIVLAAADCIPTLIFDEVDANIGGTVAAAVGQKLEQLAAHHQVIAITHLPQIARRAATHYQVFKEVQGGRTHTRIRRLSGVERFQEWTRMVGGKDMAAEGMGLDRELTADSGATEGGQT